jgi:hypothetical protein
VILDFTGEILLRVRSVAGEELGTPEVKVVALQEEKSKDKFSGMLPVASSVFGMRRKATLKP